MVHRTATRVDNLSSPPRYLRETLDSNQQLRSLWASRWLLLAFAAAAAVAAYLVSDSSEKVYRAEALAQIVPQQQSSGLALSSDQLLQVTNFYAELAKTRPVLDSARTEAAIEGGVDEVEVQAEPDLLVLSLAASSSRPDEAAAYANGYARAFSAEVDELQATERERRLAEPQRRAEQIRVELRALPAGSNEALALTTELESLRDRLNEESLSSADRVRVIQSAVAPSEAVSPKPVRNAILAFLLALVLAVAFLLGRRTIVDRYASVEEAALDVRLPALAELPRSRADRPAAIEAARKLRAQVKFSLENGRADPAANGVEAARPRRQPANVILVTSPESGAGKSYVTAALARALAADGQHVVAVDADLRRPTLHEALEVPRESGLGEVLHRGEPDRWALHLKTATLPTTARRRGGVLNVLTAGRPEGDTAEALSSEDMGQLVEALHADYEYVVIDSPPVLAIVDAVVLSRYVDAVLLTVDASRSRRRNVRRAVQTLRAVEAPLLGIVFNRSKISHSEYGYYGQQAPQGHEAPPERAEHPG